MFDLCDDLLLPPRPGVRESVFAHVSYSIAIDGESFTRHKMSEPEGCVVTVRTEEPVSGTVSITVDQSQTPTLYVPRTPAMSLKADDDKPQTRSGCETHGIQGGWQFGLWGTAAFITADGQKLEATVSDADANNSGTRFFPGGWRTAHGQQLSPNRVSLTFDNGSTIVGVHNEDCMMITWPNSERWYRLPEFPHVSKVHVVQSCHLDIGFANTSVSIINKYIGAEGYFANAPRLSQALRDRGGPESYVFLTQSWLVYLFLHCDAATFPHLTAQSAQTWRDELDCPTPERRKAFDAAVRRGDITWHALPFDAQPELLGAELFRWGVTNITQ